MSLCEALLMGTQNTFLWRFNNYLSNIAEFDNKATATVWCQQNIDVCGIYCYFNQDMVGKEMVLLIGNKD